MDLSHIVMRTDISWAAKAIWLMIAIDGTGKVPIDWIFSVGVNEEETARALYELVDLGVMSVPAHPLPGKSQEILPPSEDETPPTKTYWVGRKIAEA